MRKILVMLLALAPLVSSAATVLWFSVDPNATIKTEDDEVVGTVASYAEAGKIDTARVVDAARVVVSGEGAFHLYYQDEMGAWTLAGEIEDVMLEDGGAIQWQPVAVPGGTDEVKLQLGYYDSGGNFIEVAVATALVSDLTLDGHTSSGGTDFQSQTPWTPTMFHTTPEPTTTALLLVGAAAMLLKRKC